MSVYLFATLDTKGIEAAFLRDQLQQRGVTVRVVDCGSGREPAFEPEVSREQVFGAQATPLDELLEKNDRGEAVAAAARGAAQLARKWHAAGELSGIIGLGGSAGTTIGTSAMRAVPLGVPKLMISTLASGQVRQYVADKDILMLNSVVDILGINRISRMILTTAAAAMAGMVAPTPVDEPGDDKPLVAATMFGVTTPCVEKARETLEQAGYEVLVFHATGNGGQAMESLIADGLIQGVLDITTTELADELVGGVLSAGPHRLEAAGKRGVPQVISVGATDMVNFHAPETVPEKFSDRTFYHHNPTVTLMRTTVEENAQLGTKIGKAARAATGPVTVLLPRQGVSAIDRLGQPFDDPVARGALFDNLRKAAGETEIVELDRHINDAEFAVAAAEKLIALMKLSQEQRR